MREHSLIWLTDLHIDFWQEEERIVLYEKLQASKANGLVITGDIADGHATCEYLQELYNAFRRPIYFVLGNHDYYGTSIAVQHQKIKQFVAKIPDLYYVSNSGPIELDAATALIGHDGWADAREGKFLESTISMRDYSEIEELKGRSIEELQEALHELGDVAATVIRTQFRKAISQYKKIICLTHVPPFREVCIYNDHLADDMWSPHYVCKAVGDMLLKEMKAHPKIDCLVLAGHSHHEIHCQMLPNLEVRVGLPSYEAADLYFL